MSTPTDTAPASDSGAFDTHAIQEKWQRLWAEQDPFRAGGEKGVHVPEGGDLHVPGGDHGAGGGVAGDTHARNPNPSGSEWGRGGGCYAAPSGISRGRG